ncbi:Mis12 protein-domain-containing protein [Mycena rosella]|uniref:Mis12 protein-domain-containing protein n=1 Tax=Mycena rosella TaxID=1033263 RepID=A0AAD7G486_MYCRO|nr:Mis12 protein-domain-containing protein [Mycena rosella]
MGNADAPPPLAPPQLLTEALGFSPQLLLDDIINIANHAVQDGVNGTEDFLGQRLEAQAGQPGEEEGTHEVEQGLVAFQTLLEFHTDLAFDFFEAWSLRNIFAVPADLPVVLPHHENLDLTHTPEREQALQEEVAELQSQLEKQRLLKHHLRRANQRKAIELARARKIYESLADSESTLDAARLLPAALVAMQESVSTLPALEPATMSALTQLRRSEAGKRQWEMGKAGYMDWAISQLVLKAKEEGGEELLPDVANADLFRKACAAMNQVSRELDGADEDVEMEE